MYKRILFDSNNLSPLGRYVFSCEERLPIPYKAHFSLGRKP